MTLSVPQQNDIKKTALRWLLNPVSQKGWLIQSSNRKGENVICGGEQWKGWVIESETPNVSKGRQKMNYIFTSEIEFIHLFKMTESKLQYIY